MKQRATILAAVLAAAALSATAAFDDNFADATLRLDYVFGGDSGHTAIYLDEMGTTDGWAGRRHNLEAPFLRGNGTVTLTDAATSDTLYANSFSTLFQEWQAMPEAKRVARAYDVTLLVPMPKRPVDVTVALTDSHGRESARLSHRVDPADIQIRRIPPTRAPHRYVHRGGSPRDCVDIAVVAEGYTEADSLKFYADAERAAAALLSHEPFASMADRFNILAVATYSGDAGPDEPGKGVWNRTAHRARYDTFYYERYLTTTAIHSLYDAIAGLPVEHIIMLVNTPRYGGGGIFNQMTIASADHPTFKEVLVHEFGHAYAGLADEYNYDDAADETYPIDTEPWEPNITTLVDFGSKWGNMLAPGTAIPTAVGETYSVKGLDADSPEMRHMCGDVGVYEGAGYKAHGVYRPVRICRMRSNDVDVFCPVCTKAIIGITEWQTRPGTFQCE